MQINFNVRGTAGREGGSTILDMVVNDVANAFGKLERLAGLPLGYAPLGADGLVPAEFLGEAVTPSTLMVSATGAVNTAVTATLPAAPGKVHLITSIELVKLYSAVGVASGTGVIVASTNLPGNPSWTTEQIVGAQGACASVIKLELAAAPLRAAAAGLATTLVAPAQAQTIWRWNVTYLLVSP